MSASYHEGKLVSDPRPRALLLDAGFTLTFYDGVRMAAAAARAGVTVDGAALERAEGQLRAELRERQGVPPVRTHDDGGRSWLHRVFGRLLELAEASGDRAAHERAADAI